MVSTVVSAKDVEGDRTVPRTDGLDTNSKEDIEAVADAVRDPFRTRYEGEILPPTT